MPNELTWAQAIEQVLGASPVPLHYGEITERIVRDGLRKNLGATPAATVAAKISVSVKEMGSASPYVRVAKGTYALARPGESRPEASTPAVLASTSDETEEQYDIVTSFGMYWQRGEVDWTRNPKLLGRQKSAVVSVDFNGQRGIYLLYDGREVIYVGRTTDRALGTRLFEHTTDRMSVRWDRFSWFGLLPVSEGGALGLLPSTFDAAKMIPALEAILVEALEPRQNRKRGDDLGVVEFVQWKDPEISKRRLKAALDEALNKS